ncbi:MAG: hypothetical protein E7342_04845 [Clostridiales bacterium]|nr:hypothetical protein [Clostridiales bacterium]
MRKKLIVLFCILMALSTAMFALSMTSVGSNAAMTGAANEVITFNEYAPIKQPADNDTFKLRFNNTASFNWTVKGVPATWQTVSKSMNVTAKITTGSTRIYVNDLVVGVSLDIKSVKMSDGTNTYVSDFSNAIADIGNNKQTLGDFTASVNGDYVNAVKVSTQNDGTDSFLRITILGKGPQNNFVYFNPATALPAATYTVEVEYRVPVLMPLVTTTEVGNVYAYSNSGTYAGTAIINEETNEGVSNTYLTLKGKGKNAARLNIAADLQPGDYTLQFKARKLNDEKMATNGTVYIYNASEATKYTDAVYAGNFAPGDLNNLGKTWEVVEYDFNIIQGATVNKIMFSIPTGTSSTSNAIDIDNIKIIKKDTALRTIVGSEAEILEQITALTPVVRGTGAEIALEDLGIVAPANTTITKIEKVDGCDYTMGNQKVKLTVTANEGYSIVKNAGKGTAKEVSEVVLEYEFEIKGASYAYSLNNEVNFYGIEEGTALGVNETRGVAINEDGFVLSTTSDGHSGVKVVNDGVPAVKFFKEDGQENPVSDLMIVAPDGTTFPAGKQTFVIAVKKQLEDGAPKTVAFAKSGEFTLSAEKNGRWIEQAVMTEELNDASLNKYVTIKVEVELPKNVTTLKLSYLRGMSTELDADNDALYSSLFVKYLGFENKTTTIEYVQGSGKALVIGVAPSETVALKNVSSLTKGVEYVEDIKNEVVIVSAKYLDTVKTNAKTLVVKLTNGENVPVLVRFVEEEKPSFTAPTLPNDIVEDKPELIFRTNKMEVQDLTKAISINSKVLKSVGPLNGKNTDASIINDGKETFIRAVATPSSVTHSGLNFVFNSDEFGVAQYAVSITLRLGHVEAGKDFTLESDSRNVVLRFRTDSNGTNYDTKLLSAYNSSEPDKNGWVTITFTENVKKDTTGFWLYTYANEGSYIDVKSITIDDLSAPVYDDVVEQDPVVEEVVDIKEKLQNILTANQQDTTKSVLVALLEELFAKFGF